MTSAAFTDFLLKPELLRAVADAGFEHPSEVQCKCLPQVVLGNDVICQAKSGMGKTAVFVLGVLHQVDPDVRSVQAVVVCHTRELAYQIGREVSRFAKYLPAIRTLVCYGGVPVGVNKKLLSSERPQIVVGTPGRLSQLVRNGDLDMSGVRHFIIDEADKVLQYQGMRADVQKVFIAAPRDKQVLLFSATYGVAARAVCRKFTKTPVEVFVDSDTNLTLVGVKQFYKILKDGEKNLALASVLETLDYNQVVVFVRSQKRASALAELLCKCGFPTAAMHGRMPQQVRIKRYENFRTFQSRILVSTDLVGRGIDISHVNVVVNYDMPLSSDAYLHRVGRAGRFGTKGISVSFAEDGCEVLEDVKKRFSAESAIVEIQEGMGVLSMD